MRIAFTALFVVAGALAPVVASAAGPVVITQQSALAGGVTPGDAPGFPVAITQPGSYELGGTLSPGRSSGIEILTSNVSIDLKGFPLLAGTGVTNVGITERNAGMTNVLIENGSIRNFDFGGIIGSHMWTVRNVRVDGFRAEIGIALGDFAHIEDVTVIFNRSYPGAPAQTAWELAVQCREFCLIQDSIVKAPFAIDIFSGTILNNVIVSQLGARRNRSPLAIYNEGFANDVGYGDNTVFGVAARTAQLQPNICAALNDSYATGCETSP